MFFKLFQFKNWAQNICNLTKLLQFLNEKFLYFSIFGWFWSRNIDLHIFPFYIIINSCRMRSTSSLLIKVFKKYVMMAFSPYLPLVNPCKQFGIYFHISSDDTWMISSLWEWLNGMQTMSWKSLMLWNAGFKFY